MHNMSSDMGELICLRTDILVDYHGLHCIKSGYRAGGGMELYKLSSDHRPAVDSNAVPPRESAVSLVWVKHSR